MNRLLPVLCGLLLAGVAQASSRLAITVNEPLRFFFDGAPVSGQLAGNRVVLPGISPGVHPIEVRSYDGATVLYAGEVEVPDNAEVTAFFSRTEGIVVTAGAPPARAAGASKAPEVIQSAPGTTPGGGKPGGNNKNGETAKAPASSSPGGSTTLGRATYATAATLAPGATILATSVVPSVAHQVGGMVKNADAGGLAALKGDNGTFRQGRPIPPKAKTGMVEFVSDNGDPYYVFLDGFVIAQFGAGVGGDRRKTTLEVGRHLVEIWDANTLEVRYRGVVAIEQNVAWQLHMTDAIAPNSPDRPWMWTEQ